MDPFPTELWHHIIRNLKLQELVFVAATCKFLYAVAQPVMYSIIDLSPTCWSTKRSKFYFTLSGCPYLGELVHIISISHPPPYPGGLCQKAPLQTISRRIRLLPNLEELEIYYPTGDATKLTTILDLLPRLHAIRLFRPEISNYSFPQQADVTDTPDTALRTLFISGFLIAECIDNILSYFTRLRHTNALTMLRFENQYLPHGIVPLLLSTPSLLHLSLQTLAPLPSHPIYKLPAFALPLLAHFGGSINLIAPLIPGRPVHSVNLNLPIAYARDVLWVLENSTVPITELKLDYLAPCLQHAPRTLRRLGWVITSNDELLAAIPTLASMPDLEHISGVVKDPLGVMQTFSRQNQEETIYAVSSSCPSIQECVFASDDFGHYKVEQAWVRCGHGPWKCRVRRPEE